jgi:hypothetical protein
MSYEFQSSLFRTSTDAHRAVAFAWLTAGGLNHQEDIEKIFYEQDDGELATECCEAWEMVELNEYLEPVVPWFDIDELVEAFGWIRCNEDELFDWAK